MYRFLFVLIIVSILASARVWAACEDGDLMASDAVLSELKDMGMKRCRIVESEPLDFEVGDYYEVIAHCKNPARDYHFRVELHEFEDASCVVKSVDRIFPKKPRIQLGFLGE